MLSAEFDISDGLDKGNMSLWRFSVIALIALTIVFDAFDNQLLGLLAPAVSAEFGIERKAFAAVFAAGLIGVAVGAAIGGTLGDRLGRRWTLIGCVVLFGLPSVAIAFARNIEELSILRFVAGLGLGGLMPNALTLAAEYTPGRWRSPSVMLVVLCVPLGGILASLASVAFLDAMGWRQIFIIGGVVPLVFAVLLVFILPESPRFLLQRKGRCRQLERTLGKLGITLPPDAQIVDLAETPSTSRISTLFSTPLRHDSIVLFATFFCSMVAGYSIQSWLPDALAQIGLDATTRGLATSIFNLGGMVGILVGSGVIMKFGSRIPMLALSAFGVGCAILLTMADKLFAISPPLLYVILAIQSGLMATVQASTYSLAAYIYPSQIRATGMGISTGIGRIGAVVSSFTGAFAIDIGGGPGFFISISLAMLLAMICLSMVRRHIPSM